MSETAAIYKAIGEAMQEVGPIAKGKTTTGGARFRFRGIDDVYNAVHPIFVKHGIFSRSETLDLKLNADGKNSIFVWSVRYYFVSTDDGSQIATDVIAEGRDTTDKAAGKAMAYAHKYAICQLLSIPYERIEDNDGGASANPLRGVILNQIAEAETKSRVNALVERAEELHAEGKVSADLLADAKAAAAERRKVIK